MRALSKLVSLRNFFAVSPAPSSSLLPCTQPQVRRVSSAKRAMASALPAPGNSRQDYHNLFMGDQQAASYAAYRPDYDRDCPEAFRRVFEYFARGNAAAATPDVAVDVATGSGQAITPLARTCKRVVGIDSSSKQVAHAPALPNVTYAVADAHVLGLDSGSVDLIVVAQALHWFNRPKFYAEAARVLRPGGVLACLTYDVGVLQLPPEAGSPSDPEAVATTSKELDRIWLHNFGTRLGPYWTAPRKLVDNRYRDLEPLEPLFTDVQRVELDMDLRLTVDQLVGYVSSWSAYADFKKQHPEEEQDPAKKLKAELLAALESHAGGGTVPPDTALKLVQCMTIVMGRKARA